MLKEYERHQPEWMIDRGYSLKERHARIEEPGTVGRPEKIAVAVGYRFNLVDAREASGIDLTGCGTVVTVDGRDYEIMRAATYEESRKVDYLLDSHGDRAISDHIKRTAGESPEQADAEASAYSEWLHAEVEEHCNSEGAYEVWWDRSDHLAADDLARAARWREEGYSSPEAYLEGMLYESVGQQCEEQLYGLLLEDLEAAGDEVGRRWEESQSIWGDLEAAGYSGIELNLDEILSGSEFNVNLMFATQAEQNRDMGSIVDAFGNDCRDPEMRRIEPDDLDNALSYLVNQQGHAIAEVYRALAGEETSSPLISSIASEIQENPSDAMSELTALVRMDARSVLDLMAAVDAGRGSIEIDKSAVVGIFNQWSGCGGALDIQLEQDAALPAALVSEIQIEGTSDSNRWGAYTVDEVYGLVGDAWNTPWRLSDKEGPSFAEDYGRAAAEIRRGGSWNSVDEMAGELRETATDLGPAPASEPDREL